MRETAVHQALLGRLWTRTMDLADLDRSFTRFYAQAAPVVAAGKIRSRTTAASYYVAARRLADVSGPLPGVERLSLDDVAVATSLRVTGLLATKASIGRGIDGREAMALGMERMLGSAKRHMLNAGRSALIDMSGRDRKSGRYIRVSDGDPCNFCLLLVSRGPVFSEETPDFESHDRCGCSLAPVFESEPGGGWTPQALAAREAYESGDLGF